MRNLARESFEGSKELTDTAQEALANQGIVKAYRAEKRESDRFTDVAKRIVRANLRSASIAGASPPTIEMIGMVFVVLLLFFGQREIMAGRHEPGAVRHFPLLSDSQLRPDAQAFATAKQHGAGAGRGPSRLGSDGRARSNSGEADAGELPALKKEIELRNVSFGYANESRSVLRDVSLKIPAGTMVALVGESGGGKSTLTKLLPRFHDPSSGAVLWDGTDIREVTISSLRKQIALVTQETVLFNDTVRHNIAYGKPQASDREVEEAALIAFAHDFIRELPNGYDTIVGERGIFLSGGQRQRLAIARASWLMRLS